MAPPVAASTASKSISLILRVLTVASLVISIIILITNKTSLEVTLTSDLSAVHKIRFNDIYAYRYMLAAIVIGLAYTILQVGFTLYQISTGNHVIAGQGHLLFDFYGDKFISYVLATGAAAGFGVTKDLKDTVKIIFPNSSSNIDKFFNMAHASCSLLLIAFVFTAILSTLSSYALPKRIN